MDGDTMIAAAGLIALAIAGLTGALWDSPLVTAPFRERETTQPEGRRAR